MVAVGTCRIRMWESSGAKLESEMPMKRQAQLRRDAWALMGLGALCGLWWREVFVAVRWLIKLAFGWS
jgi:hypothetical protein